LARSSLWRISSRVISSVGLGVTLLLLARISPVAAYGDFMVSGAITTVGGILVGFGAPARVLRCAAEQDHLRLVRGLYVMHTVANLVLTAVLLAGSVAFGRSAAVAAGIIWAAGDTAQSYAQNHLAGIGRHRSASWLVVTQRVVPCATVIAMLVAGRPADYSLLAASFAVTAVVGAIAPLASVRGVKSDVKSVRRGALGWWGFTMSAVLFQLQAPTLALVANTSVVGLYAMATKVIGPVLLLPASLATVVIPELARRLDTGGAWRSYRNFSKLTLAYAGVAVICAWPAGVVVTKIAGPQYAAALPLVAGMVVAAGLSAYTQSFGALLVAAGRPNHATACIAGGQLVALMLLLTLGVWAPIEALAFAPIVAEIVVLVGMVLAVRRLRDSMAIS
jgi:O-antigen/teichoic acid export membrane protein